MNMHKTLNPTSDVDRLHIPRKKGDRGLRRVEEAVLWSVGWLENYVKISTEFLLAGARRVDGGLKAWNIVAKNRHKQKLHGNLKVKKLHGQFFSQRTETITERERWLWVKDAFLKRESGSVLFTAQGQAIRMNGNKGPDKPITWMSYKILWDFSVQTDHVIVTRRPDLFVTEQENSNCQIIDLLHMIQE